MEYEINGTSWTAVTEPGEPASLWLESTPSRGSVIIKHGNDELTLVNTRKETIPLFPVSFTDVFYAKCSDTTCQATVISNSSLGMRVPVEKNGGVPVNIQDQTTRPYDVRMYETVSSGLTLAADVDIDDKVVTLSPGHGVVAGNVIVFISGTEVFNPTVLSVSDDDITLDSPSPQVFLTSDTTIFTAITNMAINGSVTAMAFGVMNPFDGPVDVTRVMVHMTSNSPMDDGLFGSLSELTNGIVFRKKLTDGSYIQYWNAKNNGRFGELAFDRVYDDKAPSGLYGMTVRLTYAGQSKHGVAIRLYKNEALQVLVQDDLSSLTEFTVTVQGHQTTY